MTKQKKPMVFAAALLVSLLLPTTRAAAQNGNTQPAKKPPEATVATATAVKPAAKAKSEDPPDPMTQYIIGEQDVLNIVIWKERELSGTVVVRPDGKITLPLTNEIYVVGMTPVQLQDVLTEKLKPFLTVPQVTVSVQQINSRKVYLVGEVSKQGAFQINSTTTVLQLLAEAGGPRDFANRKKIYILREENGKQLRLPFNYDEVIRGKNPSQNIILRPGDTIVVP